MYLVHDMYIYVCIQGNFLLLYWYGAKHDINIDFVHVP